MVRREKHAYLSREKQIERKREGYLLDFLIVLSTFRSTEQLEDTDLEPPSPSGWIGSGTWVGMEMVGDSPNSREQLQVAHDQGWKTKVNGYLLSKRTGIKGMFIVEGDYTRKVNSV